MSAVQVTIALKDQPLVKKTIRGNKSAADPPKNTLRLTGTLSFSEVSWSQGRSSGLASKFWALLSPFQVQSKNGRDHGWCLSEPTLETVSRQVLKQKLEKCIHKPFPTVKQ